ncbi:uncharacterized protein LOC144336823 [Macaca mulatta]
MRAPEEGRVWRGKRRCPGGEITGLECQGGLSLIIKFSRETDLGFSAEAAAGVWNPGKCQVEGSCVTDPMNTWAQNCQPAFTRDTLHTSYNLLGELSMGCVTPL